MDQLINLDDVRLVLVKVFYREFEEGLYQRGLEIQQKANFVGLDLAVVQLLLGNAHGEVLGVVVEEARDLS